jgi:uncharacterized protein YpmB
MKFIKKHRFKMVTTFLVLVLLVTSFYMLWVHVPYVRNQNRLDNIRNAILSENKYDYKEYFNEYNSDQTYYILLVSEEEKDTYVVFDYQRRFIASYGGDVVSEDSVKVKFKEKFKVEPTSIEIGYENEKFVYCMKYKKDNTLTFAFYGIDNGEYIKSYRL